MIVTLLVIVGSATLIGAVLLILGVRGRRIDDHPVCARCRFDLSGAPEPRTTCPECGRDVSNPKGIKVGQRRRRPRMQVSGAAALAVSLLVWGIAGWGLWKGTNWNTYKPTGWLLFEARVGAPGEADAAISEVADRVISERPPSDARVRQFVDVVLAHQADHSKPWGDGWARAMDAVIYKGPVDAVQLSAIGHHAFVFTMETRPKVRAGEDFVIGLRVNARHGASSLAEVEPLRASVNGTEVQNRLPGALHTGRATIASFTIPAEAPGRTEIELEWRWALYTPPPARRKASDWTTQQLSAEVEVLDAQANDGVHLKTDESIDLAMREGFHVSRSEVQRFGSNVHFALEITGRHLPADIAFAAFIRQGEREWEVGPMNGRKGEPIRWGFGLGPAVNDLGQGPVDVILRPSESVLRRTFEMTTAWDGELVLENVPVVWPPAQPVPVPE